ncbi:MAG: hypothetical protein AAB152_07940, partial [Candidatus Coatesbacteria bacterium]
AGMGLGQIWTFTVTGIVGMVCIDNTSVSNTAFVAGLGVCSTTVMTTNNTGFLVNAPVLSFTATKSIVAGSGTGIGSPVTYRIVVANTGEATISDLTIVDTISAVVTGVTPMQPGGWVAPVVTSVASGTRYVWSATGLTFSPGTNLTFELAGNYGLVCASTAVSNTAYVFALSCNEARVFSNVVGAVVLPAVQGLTIAKTQNPLAPGVGSAVTYQIVVTNTGAATITNLVLVDTVAAEMTGGVQTTPAGFTAQFVTQNVSGTVFSWINSAPFLPGTSATFAIDGVVGLICFETTVSNTAYLTASTACTTTRMISNGTSFAIPAPAMSLSVVKTQTGGNGVGAPVQYQIVITNIGAATVDSLTIVDTVSPVVTGIATTQPGFGAPVVASVASGTRYLWSAAGLNFLPMQVITITIDGTMGLVCANTAVSNTAFVIARDISNCGEITLQSNVVGSVVSKPVQSLTIVKTQVPAAPIVGAAVTYQIVVTNTGAMTIDSMVV